MKRKSTNPDFMNGVPELIILRLLEREPAYGYQLIQRMKQESNSVLEYGEGSIYPVLHRLVAEGCLCSDDKKVDGRMRIVYKLTAKGRKRLADSTARWLEIAAAVGSILGDTNGRPELA